MYFVRNPATGDIKIGYSVSPASRLSQLQTAHAERLHILATVPGSTSLEASLHRRFAAHSRNGEWFRGDAEIYEFIAANLRAMAEHAPRRPPPPPPAPPVVYAGLAAQAKAAREALALMRAKDGAR